MDLDALRDLERQGELPPLLLFWGHTGEGPGPWVLSQWYPTPFTVDGVRYATAEHWMMAAKARLFGDDEALAKVLASDDPRDAKAAGRGVRGFDSRRWAAEADGAVVAGSIAKFTSSELLSSYLLGTAPAVLVEASPVDAVWGTGLATDHPDARVPSRWPGTNRLGFALMAAREQISTTRV